MGHLTINFSSIKFNSLSLLFNIDNHITCTGEVLGMKSGHMLRTGPKMCFIPQNCEKYTNFDSTGHRTIFEIHTALGDVRNISWSRVDSNNALGAYCT